ncbi:MAG: hypothetical protein LBT50_07120 [Prevotellaceae bacterium]|jgi:hypothetical protein|nr:hypothetical protein [Prevotellaceae bacterium]
MNKGLLCILLFLPLRLFAGNHGDTATSRAQLHPVVMEKPAPDFFEGAVLGNGGMGVVVTTRPDAVCFHFGHNNVWDIRIAENHREEIGTFEEIFAKAGKLSPDLPTVWDDKEFRDYMQMTADNYRKLYPRPFPCGTAILGFDRRETELLGHKIDIANGLCEVYLLHKGKKLCLQVFANMKSDELWFRLVDELQNVQPACFNRFRIIPDSKTPKEFPKYRIVENEKNTSLGFVQTLPYLEPEKYDKEKGHPKDRAFSLEACLNVKLKKGTRYTTSGLDENLAALERYVEQETTPFVGYISLKEGLSQTVNAGNEVAPSVSGFAEAFANTGESWKQYWSKSAVSFADDFLEKIWYWNHYFFNCATKDGAICPGLFANWSHGNIGTAWHGDYHLNYNTQQPFWLPFSSNHLDKNLPYVDMVYQLLPVSRQWAKEYYGMRGAFFPHSAYPVDMTLHPYPVPDWGWEVFETPWTVQGLWWHYLYSMDTQFLKDRAYVPIKDAVLFLVDYMKRPDAHGKRWDDDKYHIFPSVPPELYGLQPGFKFNYDTQIDIALTKFIFKAYLEATETLKLQKPEKELVLDVNEILLHLPDYSTTITEKYGTIYTSVPGENGKIVYNAPANLTHVFPGEDFGIDAPDDVYQILKNTYRAQENEGGNDIVFLNLQAARLGLLDMEKFKRQVNYAMLPNKTVADKVMQIGGRYNDNTDFAFMAPMGIWLENFALPVVINECLMQSYSGTIRLFPNWDKQVDAEFSTLRATGAFLVSSKLKNGTIEYVEIFSEKGKACQLKNPWVGEKVRLVRNGQAKEILSGDLLKFQTAEEETIVLRIN